MRKAAAIVALGLIVGCSDTTTAPKPDALIVGPPFGIFLNQGFTAIAISFRGGQILFVQAQTVKKATNGSPTGTFLRFERTIEQDGTILEDFTVANRASDFTGATRTRDWALHTDGAARTDDGRCHGSEFGQAIGLNPAHGDAIGLLLLQATW